MPSVKFIGNSKQRKYMGDGITCYAGDVIDVSLKKKDQLLKDFPKLFIDVENQPSVKLEISPEVKKDAENKATEIADKIKDLTNKKEVYELAKKLDVPHVNAAMSRTKLEQAILKHIKQDEK